LESLNLGLEIKIVGSEIPIGNIVCDYSCVASFATASWRDLRASCPKLIIVGFMGVSKFVFSDPRFVYGRSEGIGCIEEDGSYDSSIFYPKVFYPIEKQSIPDILLKLAVNGNEGIHSRSEALKYVE
jgi:hypothetical protein